MKLKAAVRYQVTNLLALLLVFSGIIGALLIMGNIVATSSGGVFVASGISTLGFGFIGILAFTTFEGDLRFSFAERFDARTGARELCDLVLSGGVPSSYDGERGVRRLPFRRSASIFARRLERHAPGRGARISLDVSCVPRFHGRRVRAGGVEDADGEEAVSGRLRHRSARVPLRTGRMRGDFRLG